jgi:hypothetical protein
MTQPAPSTKLVLLEDRRGSDDADLRPRMRRYRIARVRFDGLPPLGERRFEYLKHCHD